MAGIGDMVTSSPTGAESVGGGDDQLRGIKDDVTASFPAFALDTTLDDDVCNKTGPQLDDAPEASEDTQVIGGTWTFTALINFDATVQFNSTVRMLNDQNLTIEDNTGPPGTPRPVLLVDASDVCQLSNNNFDTVVRGNNVSIPGEFAPAIIPEPVLVQPGPNVLEIFNSAGASQGFIRIWNT